MSGNIFSVRQRDSGKWHVVEQDIVAGWLGVDFYSSESYDTKEEALEAMKAKAKEKSNVRKG